MSSSASPLTTAFSGGRGVAAFDPPFGVEVLELRGVPALEPALEPGLEPALEPALEPVVDPARDPLLDIVQQLRSVCLALCVPCSES